jgi:hypothetical protein
MTAKRKTTKHSHVATRKKSHKRLFVFLGVAITILLAATITSVSLLHAHKVQAQTLPISYSPTMQSIGGALAPHQTSTLVASQDMLTALRPVLNPKEPTFALNSCPSVNDTTTQQLQKRSLAVLLYINNNRGPRQCTLAQIVLAYGRPNASETITGTLADPRAVVLFYDAGLNLSGPINPISPPQAPATVVPTSLSSLPQPACSGQTVLSVVAHEDDDLLFMNPDHLTDIQNGDCMRTIYLTAGDAGLSSQYWLGREQGAEAAYDTMADLGHPVWIERTVSINSHEYVRMDSPRGDPNITLVFVRLPDGNLKGNGFWTTHYESLYRLETGAITTMTSVDGQSTYTKQDVLDMLTSLMLYYQPDQIDAQTPVNQSTTQPDHSDHLASGTYALAAYKQYAQGDPLRNIPVTFYTGYPIQQKPQNISGQILAEKSAAFFAYAMYDSHVCNSIATCANNTYGQYLEREYTYTSPTSSM